MKYYYLDSDKNVKGPVTEAELRILLASGQLNDETKAAAAGDNGWKSLSELLSKDADNCSTWNNSGCKCPYCEQTISGEIQDGKCPHCNREIVHQSRGLWNAFTTAVRKSFDYKGRSTRTEFWGFILFFYVFSLIIEYLTGFLVPSSVQAVYQSEMELARDTNDFSHAVGAFETLLSDPMVILTTAVYWLYLIVMTFPLLAVTVRRLHDTGRTALPVILGCASHIAFIVSFALMMCDIYTYLIINEEQGMQNSSDFVYWMIPALISTLFLMITSLYIFIMMLLPSQPGVNKYGPQKN